MRYRIDRIDENNTRRTIATQLVCGDAIRLAMDEATAEVARLPNRATVNVGGPMRIDVCIGVYRITSFEMIQE